MAWQVSRRVCMDPSTDEGIHACALHIMQTRKVLSQQWWELIKREFIAERMILLSHVKKSMLFYVWLSNESSYGVIIWRRTVASRRQLESGGELLHWWHEGMYVTGSLFHVCSNHHHHHQWSSATNGTISFVSPFSRCHRSRILYILSWLLGLDMFTVGTIRPILMLLINAASSRKLECSE